MDIMPILMPTTDTDTVMPTTVTTRGLLMLRLLTVMLTMVMATPPTAMLIMDTTPTLMPTTDTDTAMPITATTRGPLMLSLLMAMLTMVMATPPTVMPTMATLPTLMPTTDTVMPTTATDIIINLLNTVKS